MGLPWKFNMWRSIEETGAFVAAMFIIKSGRQLLEQLHYDGRCTCPNSQTILPVWPTFTARCGTDCFFHFSICISNCLGWYWGWQRTSYIKKTVTVISFLKIFVRVIFKVTDNCENGPSMKIEHVEQTWRSMGETCAFVATLWWQVCLPISARTVGLYRSYGTYGWFLLDLLQ